MYNALRVFIDTLDGSSIAVLVRPSETVFNLKEKIFGDTGTPIDRQRLLYKSKLLRDSQLVHETLSDPSPKIHLVANLQYEASPIVRMTHSLILRNLRTYRRLRNTQSHSLSPEDLRQVLTQHALTINSLTGLAPMPLQAGQWVDVKDTVDQWLEAQVLQVQDGSAYIHYNGWPARWNEWISIGSPRIRPFRSVTFQTAGKPCKSPAPVGDAEMQLENASELELVSQNTQYLNHLLEISYQGRSLVNNEELAGFGQTHVASLDRIGRFMIDTAHLLATSKVHT